MVRFLVIAGLTLVAACGAPVTEARPSPGAPRIVSLDFCADQFVLKLVDHEQIAGLSPDAGKSFSYLREKAKGLPVARSGAEDVLLKRPDVVVRTYGGGPNATAFFERAGVKVVQIPYANNIAAIKESILATAAALGEEARGQALADEMDARIAALPDRVTGRKALYLTSKGAVAGTGTSIDEMLAMAGFENFQTQPGWASAPLERLAYEQPDVIAAGFFETSDLASDVWSPARHPLARRRLAETPVIDIPGAWTACGGWFALNAVEALAAGAAAIERPRP